jgi:hypothetical protein
MPKAQQEARDYCAAAGKQPFVLDSKVKESLWQGSVAALRMVCIDPQNLIHTTDAFGALLLADMHIKGAQVLQVVPGSIADRAGLKHADMVLEYAGNRVVSAEALQTAVSSTVAGSRVPMRLYRDQMVCLRLSFDKHNHAPPRWFVI